MLECRSFSDITQQVYSLSRMARYVKNAKNFIAVLVVAALFIFKLKFTLNFTKLNFASKTAFNSRKLLHTCGRFPTTSDIVRDNEIWQTMKMDNGSMKLYNAYLDLRMNEAFVRINVHSIQISTTKDIIYCQFWYDGQTEPFVVKTANFIDQWGKDLGNIDNYTMSYLVACPLPVGPNVVFPSSVSLTANPCDEATNNFKIIDYQPHDRIKRKFGVCTKQLVLDDRKQGVRIIEWVSMLRILGAHKVHMKVQSIHPDLVEVLNYLQEKNLIEWEHYKDPSGFVNSKAYSLQNRILHTIPINDCFYKIRNSYEFIIFLDPSEIILPVVEEDRNWQDILNRLDSSYSDFVGIASMKVNYLPQPVESNGDVPDHNYMLQHVHRSFEYKEDSMKSFVQTKNVLVAQNGFATHCLNEKDRTQVPCSSKIVDKDISQLSHYSDNILPNIQETFVDKKIWKFKDELVSAVSKTLKETGFKP